MITLGTRSLQQLATIHPDLKRVVMRAAEISNQDFGAYEGMRTIERQKELVRTGKSQTMASKHLPHPDGRGWAVDLVPWVRGAWSWSWDVIWPVTAAMQKASADLGVPVTWGGVWDRLLSELGPGVPGLQAGVEAYKVRHAGSDFLDGPHFQYGRN